MSSASARAANIARDYQPANFNKLLAPGAAKNHVNVSAAFVYLSAGCYRSRTHGPALPSLRSCPTASSLSATMAPRQPRSRSGQPVPSPLSAGPDPSAPQEEQLKHDVDGNLLMPDELKWIADFDLAVKVGMGFRIDLNETQAQRGFDRVLVVGLRLSADEQAAKGELETLFQHHAFSRAGLAVRAPGHADQQHGSRGLGFQTARRSRRELRRSEGAAVRA